MSKKTLRRLFIEPLFARERLMGLHQPRHLPAMERVRRHLSALKAAPRNIPVAMTDVTPIGALMTLLAIPALARHSSLSNLAGFTGGVLGGNLMQRAVIRAGLAGGAVGDILGRSIGHMFSKRRASQPVTDLPFAGTVPIPTKLQGMQSLLPKAAGIRATVIKEAFQDRATIWRNGSAAYTLEDAATAPGMDQSDKIPYEDTNDLDRKGGGDIDQTGRRRGLRSVVTFGLPTNEGADNGRLNADGGRFQRFFFQDSGELFPHINEPQAPQTDLANEIPDDSQESKPSLKKVPNLSF